MASDGVGDGSTMASEQRRAQPTPGRFELLGVIGRGGMGEVLEARDRQFGRIVAIKRIIGELTPARRERFDLEAEVTGQLEHAGIPAVYERGILPDGAPYYAMKRIRGRSLAEAIAACRGLDDRLRLIPVVAQVARTIGFAHEHGVLHRDIKPGNIVLSDHGEVFVLDWGLAKRRLDTASDSGQQTRDGQVLGTPAYMAPEQALGSTARIDVHTDVFAIGALLYHVLTGKPPYDSEGDTSLLMRATLARYVPVRQRVPEVPGALAAVCERAMAEDPERRPRSASEIAALLEAASAEALRRRGEPGDWMTAVGLGGVFVAAIGGAVEAISRQVAPSQQALGTMLALLCGTVAATLIVADYASGGRMRLGQVTLALVLATPMFACTGFASGLARAADGASKQADADYLRAMLGGLFETTGSLVIGFSITAALLVLWAFARWRIARRSA